MKRFSLGLIAAGVTASLGAYAAHPAAAAPFQVNIPNLTPGFEFTVEGLYVRPTNNDLDYAIVTNAGPIGTASTIESVKPTYNFGFRLGAGYVFPNSGNDARLSWTHFNNTDSNAVHSSGDNITAFNAGDTGPFTDADASAKFKYDAVDLDAGQFVNIGTRLQTRFFGGLRYASLKRDFNTGFSTTVEEFGVANSSKFRGLGPRFGIDAAYHVTNCFGVVGHLAAALLVGKQKVNATAVTITSGEVNIASAAATNTYRVVPSVDAKLGADYTMGYGNSIFTVEAGYQVTHYADSIDSLNSGNTNYTSSFGLNGPYLSLNVKM